MGKITGIMNIDEYGRRRDFNIRILDFRPNVVQTAFWDVNGLHLIRNEKELENYLYKSIQEKTFKISTREVRNIPLSINIKIDFYINKSH